MSNTVDNVEQVLVHAPIAGPWTVRVAGTSMTDPQLPVQGFVVVADAPLQRWVHRSIAEFGPTAPRTIPDGNEASLSVPFAFLDVGTVTNLRVHVEIEYDARGNLRIELEAPDGQSVLLETEDSSERRDIYAIYPDTRSYDGDVTELFGTPSVGTWTVKIVDTQRGNIGSIQALALELDTDGRVNEPPVAVVSSEEPVVCEQTGTLYGAMSFDPEGHAISFVWTQVDGSQLTLDGVTTSTATYIAPSVETDTFLTFNLRIDDGRGAADTAIISVTVQPPNQQGRLRAPACGSDPSRTAWPDLAIRPDPAASTDHGTMPRGPDLEDGVAATVDHEQGTARAARYVPRCQEGRPARNHLIRNKARAPVIHIDRHQRVERGIHEEGTATDLQSAPANIPTRCLDLRNAVKCLSRRSAYRLALRRVRVPVRHVTLSRLTKLMEKVSGAE